MTATKPETLLVLQASKARRLARLGVIITVRAGDAAYDYPAGKADR